MQPYKICPQCQTPATLNCTFCARCGRQYRTHLVSSNSTGVEPKRKLTNPVKARIIAVGILVAIFGAVFLSRFLFRSPVAGTWQGIEIGSSVMSIAPKTMILRADGTYEIQSNTIGGSAEMSGQAHLRHDVKIETGRWFTTSDRHISPDARTGTLMLGNDSFGYLLNGEGKRLRLEKPNGDTQDYIDYSK